MMGMDFLRSLSFVRGGCRRYGSLPALSPQGFPCWAS